MLKQLIARMWSGGFSDSDLYGQVAREIAMGQLDVGLWTKACAATDGDTKRAEARYIELRVASLKAQRRAYEQQERRQALQRRQEAQQQQLQLRHETLRSNKIAELSHKIAAIQGQMWELHDSPDAQRRRRKTSRISGTVLGVLTLVAFLYGLAQLQSLGTAAFVLLFGVISTPCISLIWFIINSGPSPSRAALGAQLESLERERSRT